MSSRWEAKRLRRQQMAAEIREGDSVQAVAQRHGVTISTVRNACRVHQVRPPIEPRGVKPCVGTHFAILQALLQGGVSYTSLALKLGRSLPYVKFVAKEARRAGFDV